MIIPSIILDMTAGAEKMAKTDPHGFTLSLIAVCVVFTALVVLYFVYSLIGKVSRRSFDAPVSKPRPGKGRADSETAAAIALALQAELSEADKAAIAMALHLYFNEYVHDSEPGIITIMPSSGAWADKSLTFRKTPRK